MKLETLGTTENLVTFSAGDLPILLTAPHGGCERPPEVAMPRQERKGYKTRTTEIFCTERDENTLELLFQLAESLEQEIGKPPYIIAARFDRKYIDANRDSTILGPEEIEHQNHAYDDPAAKPYYEQYHRKIRHYLSEIKNRFGGEGLLFDLHGTVFQDKRLVVGMVNYDPTDFQRHFRRGHVAVDRLIECFGFDALYHPYTGFLSLLQGRKMPGGNHTEVMPTNRFERASHSGGFTVINYGSNRPGGINALHLECSLKMRTTWLARTVEIYTQAIQTLYRNAIEAPYIVETVFAGKKKLGTLDDKKQSQEVNFEFVLKRCPMKNYPALVVVHTRRVSGQYNSVTLNNAFMGHLVAGAPISSFNVGNKNLVQLKKQKNQLIITAGSLNGDPQNRLDNFDVVKVNVMYCAS